MKQMQRYVILIRLIELLREGRCWCGETRIQKAAFFLQEMAGCPTGFDFIMHKHAPFSFDLSDELAAMQACGMVSLQMEDPDYGPSIVPTLEAEKLCEQSLNTPQDNRIAFVANLLSGKSVVELEWLATAFFRIRVTASAAAPALPE